MPADPPTPGEEHALGTPAAVDAAVQQLFCGARRRLDVRAPRLDFPCLSSPHLIGCLTPLITGGQGNQARILVDDEAHFLAHCPRIVDLARKFSSFVTVRRLPPEYAETDEVFITVDGDAFLHMRSPGAYPATTGRGAPARVTQLERRFGLLWEKSEAVSELSTLGL